MNSSWFIVRPRIPCHISGFIGKRVVEGMFTFDFFWFFFDFFTFLEPVPVFLIFNDYADFTCFVITTIPRTEENGRPCQWSMMEILTFFLKGFRIDIKRVFDTFLRYRLCFGSYKNGGRPLKFPLVDFISRVDWNHNIYKLQEYICCGSFFYNFRIFWEKSLQVCPTSMEHLWLSLLILKLHRSLSKI